MSGSSSVTALASAVEEQSAATSDIVRNVESAANGNSQVSNSISEVSRLVQETARITAAMTTGSERLASEAGQLRNETETMLHDIKAV